MSEEKSSFIHEQMDIVQHALFLKIWCDSVFGIVIFIVLGPLWVFTRLFTRRPFWYEAFVQEIAKKIEIPPLAFFLSRR